MSARPHAYTLQKLAVALAAIVVTTVPAHDPRATVAVNHQDAKAVQPAAHVDVGSVTPQCRHDYP